MDEGDRGDQYSFAANILILLRAEKKFQIDPHVVSCIALQSVGSLAGADDQNKP